MSSKKRSQTNGLNSPFSNIFRSNPAIKIFAYVGARERDMVHEEREMRNEVRGTRHDEFWKILLKFD